MLKTITSIILFLAPMVFPSPTAADYVLPYPSYMPGNGLYRISRFIDEAKRYWYWGNLASLRYYLNQSDKALVEAKTLFEYKQYLLAVRAIGRSDKAFAIANEYSQKVIFEYKDSHYGQTLRDAAGEHVGVLTNVMKQTPEEFYWSPEKESPQSLKIHQILYSSISIRENIISKQ